MTKVFYRRTSSLNQNLDRQETPADCGKVFEEKISAVSRERHALKDMLEWVREGDEVVVWSICRLARDLRDLQNIITKLNNKGVTVTFLTEKLSFSANQNDPFARLQLQMMGAFCEFDRQMILLRQREGINKARERGCYKGRKATIQVERIKELKSRGLGATEIAEELQIGRASVYRLLNANS